MNQSARAGGEADFDYTSYLDQSLSTEGGHLWIGHGGTTLYFGRGSMRVYDTEVIKGQALAKGVAIIDSRSVPFAAVWDLAVKGPMAAVGRPASPAPWDALSFVPLDVIARSYGAAGATLFNLPDIVAPG